VSVRSSGRRGVDVDEVVDAGGSRRRDDVQDLGEVEADLFIVLASSGTTPTGDCGDAPGRLPWPWRGCSPGRPKRRKELAAEDADGGGTEPRVEGGAWGLVLRS
jgi:hypothetical protein